MDITSDIEELLAHVADPSGELAQLGVIASEHDDVEFTVEFKPMVTISCLSERSAHLIGELRILGVPFEVLDDSYDEDEDYDDEDDDGDGDDLP